MEFSEEKATEIIEKFGLDVKTIRVWRTRGTIPEKYNNPDFEIRTPVTERAELIRQERVCEILRMSEINIPVFQELIKSPVSDVVRGKSTFTANELLSAEKEVRKLKIDVLRLTEKNIQANLKKIISDSRIKHYIILRYTLKDNDIKSIQFALEKSNGIDSFMFEKVKDAFVKFAIQLNL